MPSSVCACCNPNNPYSHLTEWFETFSKEDKLHSIVVETFAINKDTLEGHQNSQKENWVAGKFMDAGTDAAKYWKTMHNY